VAIVVDCFDLDRKDAGLRVIKEGDERQEMVEEEVGLTSHLKGLVLALGVP
jgi:hypothetical protein